MRMPRLGLGLRCVVAALVMMPAVPAMPVAAASELPLTGTTDVTVTGDAVEIDLAYTAEGTVDWFQVRITGPNAETVLFESRDMPREIAWSETVEGLTAGGEYTVTVSARTIVGGTPRAGATTRTVTAGAVPVLPPARGGVAGVQTQVEPLPQEPVEDLQVDVMIYGATPSGVMAALSAARPGTEVVLVEPSAHVGGMMSSGLSATDYGHVAMMGGLTRDFFDRTEAAEGSAYGRYRFQPSTAETAFRAMLSESSVLVLPQERLKENRGVEMDGPRIVAIETDAGRRIAAAAFVDASYEGDLMAAAGVSYRIGRESTAAHGESHAGVRAPTTVFTVPAGVDPAVPLAAPGPVGSADGRIQNSNFRLCFSSDPKNRVPFEEPNGYDPGTYDLAASYLASRLSLGELPDITWFLWPVALPDGKFDVNNNGPVSIGVNGLNTAYPDGSYDSRAAIADELRNYTAGFLYFLANDMRVPARIRSQMGTYGLCADEFADTDNWPRILYLREGRRMEGRYLLTQRDIEVARVKSDTITVGSYAFDSHHVSRWMDNGRRLRVEGGFWSGRANATRFSIPYRALTPRAEEATNLLVSVTVSATHVAYSAVRLEPQYMMMGEAAGLAAHLVAAGAGSTQAVNIGQLQSLLKQQGAVLENHVFWDTVDSPFRGDIEATFGRGVTFGCSAIYFCPTAPTVREVMAGFLANALRLPPAKRDHFTDDEASPHEDSINRVADAGVTAGCGGGGFCPSGTVTRGQMAAFLGRAFRLAWTQRDYFTDDETNMFEGDINRLAASGITAGCGGTRFCPAGIVSREQMSAFLWRAIR